MHPLSGFLNLATNLPHWSAKRDIGPYLYISYGSADKETDSVTTLCCDPYDVVCVLLYYVTLHFLNKYIYVCVM